MRLVRPLSALAAVFALAAAADEDRYADERQEFVAAYAAAGADEDRDSRALRRYPLYSYLQSARLERALRATAVAERTDERAEAFLERHGEEPVGARLRRAWLTSLARRAQWETFLAHYRDSGDTALRCQALNARIARSGRALEPQAALEADIVQRWLTPRRLPQECESAFAWLRERGALTPELIEQRARLLLEAGHASFARVIARRLPAERAAPLGRWADLIERPIGTLDALLAGTALELDPAALADGYRRLARNDPKAALERFLPLRASQSVDTTTASRMALALALGLAWDRRPEALALFEQVDPADVDDYALTWRARAALWNGDWPLLEASIAAMSPAVQDETRWRYWAARAAEQRGDVEAATALYHSIMPRDNFYSAQAAVRLGIEVVPHAEALPRDADAVERLAGGDYLVRARELLLAGMRTEAVTEWLAGIAKLDAEGRRQAVHVAADWRWYDVAIATASRQGVFYDYALLYPRPYDAEVRSAATAASLEPQLVYGLIRQESLFQPDARSSAGALGLAQLIPDTARTVARLVSEPAPAAHELFEPERNVRLGAAYLRNLIDRFGGHTAVALAGYNAGPLAAERWLPRDTPVETDVWIENIPFNETREYVQRVLWHSLVFGWLEGGGPQDASTWPAIVAPREPPAVASTGTAGR